ncbi:MAG: hypothetical protein H6818_23865 [Phycisphaerales bacterium]|nr:hypothetical protein [Phycisphaerales bacterium]
MRRTYRKKSDLPLTIGLPGMHDEQDRQRAEMTTLDYASKHEIRRHPGPSDEEIVRFFGWGMWLAIAIPFVVGVLFVAFLLVSG